jgi:hypothetical protein
MVVIDRKIGGMLPYRAVFFPSDKMLADSTERPRLTQLARLFWTATELENPRHVARHERSATVCIALDKPLDELFKGVAKNTRYEIRQAEKLGNRIKVVRNGAGLNREIVALYNSLASTKTELAKIDESALTRYQGHSDTFVAYLDERPVCGHVLLRDTEIGRARLLFSASRRFDDRETARLSGFLNRFLHWHEISAYRDEGFTTYDLGGIRQDSRDGITQFKMSFGGEVVAEHTYLCAGIPWLASGARAVFEKLSTRQRRLARNSKPERRALDLEQEAAISQSNSG